MSGIFDQIINYSPPLIVSGTVNYKGTWNASTNNPTLNDPPAASTKGDYYVVSTAGTQFSITFGVGDWIISNGTAWEKVDLTDAVSSVFGRTGAVVGVSTDYSAVGITNTAIGAANPSSGAFTSLSSSSTTTLNGTTIPASKTLVVTTDKLSALAATTSAELAGVISDETGSGALVFATSPTLVTPILGTPQSGTLTSCTGLPISTGVSGLGTGIATALAVNTGSAGAPVLFNGALGTPSSGTVTNLTGTASINTNGAHNGTVGATTPSTGAFTTLSSDPAGAGVGLLLGKDSAIRQTSSTGGTQFFDVATGGATHGTFRFRGSSAFTSYATIDSNGLAVTGALSSTGILSGPGFRASKTTATSGLVKIQDEGANVYNVIGSRNNADSAALPLNFQATSFAFNGAVAVTGNGSFTATQPTLSLIATGGTNSSNLVFTPAVGYDAIISTSVASKLIFKYNSTEVARIDSGSFAVTGALSATGALAIGNTVATAVAVASTHKVTIVIGGVTYYLLATNV